MNKLCSKCGLPGEFGKDKRSKDGLTSACKVCLRAQSREYMARRRVTHRDELNQRSKEWKKKKVKENPDYWKEEYNKNPERARKNSNKYYHNNRDKCLERQREYQNNNRDICRLAAKNWKINHPERNKELRRNSTEAYRARKRAAFTTDFTVEQLMERMSVFGYKCAYCGGKFEEIDHVIALSRGGAHCLANLRPACKKCNQSKSNKLLSEWSGRKI